MTKRQHRIWKTELQMEWLDLIEKLYFTIVDLFWRYKSDNIMNIAYISCLKTPSTLGKRYYYTLHFKSATLHIHIMWSGIASPQSQHRWYMVDQRVDWRQGIIFFLPTFKIDVASDYIELLIARNNDLKALQEKYYTLSSIYLWIYHVLSILRSRVSYVQLKQLL